MSEASIQPTAWPQPGGTVHLMLTCLCDAFWPEVGLATAECIERFGFRVEFNEAQTCCGQPAFNAGDREASRAVARHTLDVFREAPVVVTPSGSCAAMVRWGYPQLFEGCPDLGRALELARRTWELSEFLSRATGDRPWGGHYPQRVALHAACHLRELTGGDAARGLLASIDGLQLTPVATPEQCCGFGGSFAVSFPWMSSGIGRAKLDALRGGGAEEVVSTDMGCLMHLDGLDRRGKGGMRFRHLAEVLRDSQRASTSALLEHVS